MGLVKRIQRGGMGLTVLLLAIIFLMVAEAADLAAAGLPGSATAASRSTIRASTETHGEPCPMPHVATTVPELLERLGAAAHLDGDRLIVDDEAAFRGDVIRDLAWTAAFATDEPIVAAAQWLIHEAARELGAGRASIQELYVARARGEVSGLHGPGDQHPGRRRSTWPGPSTRRPRRPTSAR